MAITNIPVLVVGQKPVTDRRRLFALLHRANITGRDERLALLTAILHRPVDSTADLTDIELRATVDVLSYWDRLNELPTRAANAINTAK